MKAYLKVLPANILPEANFDIVDPQFFNYINCKIPPIDAAEIERNLVYCPKPILRLDTYEALPILIEKATIKDAMNTMNNLFPHRNVWNMNIIEACNRFEKKIMELNPEEQINLCLIGYHEQKE